MGKNSPFVLICILAWLPMLVLAQQKKAGPIIEDYGKVWKIEDTDFKTDYEREFKAVFDVMQSPSSHQSVNPSIETVARYLNMHAQAGVAKESIKAVLVIHNEASKDIMTNKAYESKYNTNNPNVALIEQLMAAGVDIVFCGQSSLSREIPMNDVIPGVQMSLSAMTALIQLQDEGYRLIKF